MMGEFHGKVGLITGAGRVIGRSIAETFVGRGAVVAVTDINPISLDETLRCIHVAGGRGKGYLYDIAKRMPIQAMVNEVLEDWGRIDILINSSVVAPRVPLLDMDEWDWLRTLDVNLSGPFFTMQQVGRAMREQGGGVMVNIVSVEGGEGKLPGRAAYEASQAGLIGLTRQAAGELAAYHIRVNAVYAGGIDVLPGEGDVFTEGKQPGFNLAGQEKMQEMCDLISSLCSAASDGITGQVLKVGDEK